MNLIAGAVRAAGDAWRAATGEAPRPSIRQGRVVAVTPGQVVLCNRLDDLLRYDPVTPQVHAVPLLIVPT